MSSPSPNYLITKPAPPRRPWIARALGLAALAAALVFGAVQLQFLCDDAYILFRFVSNARDGFGLVWNPPPFAPVEGYTQFLWVLFLWAAWSWFGIEPPSSANAMSILCGVALFAVVARTAFRLRDRTGARSPAAVAFAALAVVVGNRTFLQSLTSGLDTSLFNLGFVSWVLLAFRAREHRTTNWLALWSAAAAATALTRPDGLLLGAATAATAIALLAQRRLHLGQVLVGLAPLLAVVAHVLWRHSFYGEWLPNTYYAKVVTPWPEAGLRYFACFALENGVWIWAPIALTWCSVQARRGPKALLRSLRDHLPAAAAVAATVFQVGYYVLRVGGDPFEYRVLSHTIPLGVLSAVAMAGSLRAGGAVPIACAVALAIGGAVGWIHLALTDERPSLHYVPLAHKLPAWAEPLARWHDRNQAWLHAHAICGRRHQHALFLESMRAELPERSRRPVDQGDLPVATFRGVGLAGWVLPDVAVLDIHGLNDWVAARTPVQAWSTPFLPKAALELALAGADPDRDGRCTRPELEAAFGALPGSTPDLARDFVSLLLLLFADERHDSLTGAEAQRILPFFSSHRFMGHERHAPPEYVAALAPNVTVQNGIVVVHPREVPLTADRVRAIEQEWRERIRRSQVR